MAGSKVYFTSLRTHRSKGLLDKLERLAETAGMMNIDFNKKFTAVKLHFGEPGNLAYIRPNYAARIVSMIKAAGGLPFLTDSNTLYSGRRSNAVDHLQSAVENGFNPLTCGCNVIIADGLKGTDYREVPINGKNCKAPKIGSAVADADIVISLNHFKGHELTGFGGALKNLGMGSGSIGGKLEMHSSSKPVIVAERCTGCNQCVTSCAHDAVHLKNKKAVIDYARCVGCGQCIAVCRFDAANPNWDSGGELVHEKVAEYALAVLKGKSHFHVSFIMDVSPDCDCWGKNDAPIVPDIGIAASADPVALDHACVDLVNAAPALKDSKAGDAIADGAGPDTDRFRFAHPTTDWRIGVRYAASIGLGTAEYELVRLD